MDTIRSAVAVAGLAVAVSGAALADDHIVLPADTPAGYRSECGGCHVAFPPGLLARDDWRDIMARLSAHFGENAAIPDPQRRELEDFLVRGAGGARRFGSRSDPPRLSSTTWFRRTHGAMRAAFRDSRVGSAANCGACHPDAEAGRFDRTGPLVRQLPRRE